MSVAIVGVEALGGIPLTISARNAAASAGTAAIRKD
jgi:hypothetical protein